MIGTFGQIVFQTSSSKVLAFDEFTRKGAANFAEHPVLDDKPVLQHVGAGLDDISFTIRLDVGLGINPKDEIEKLRDVKNAGDHKNLIIGETVLGAFVVTEIEEFWNRVDNLGNLLLAVLTLNLKEYVNGN